LAAKPILLKPAKNKTVNKTKVAFDWTDAVCGTSYKLTVKNLTAHTTTKKTVTASKAKLALGHGSYKWFVQACDTHGCSKSKAFKFTN
jgi:Chitinase A, N-terminal domain